MTKEETAQLIRMNFTLYKLGSKPLTDEEMETTIDVWTYQFRDYPGEVVKRAFLAANRVCIYPITVADIYKQLSQCIDPEAEWGALADAARKAQKYMSWKNFPMVTGIDEKGYDAETNKLLVSVNPQWFRPTDVDNLWGDPTKAKTVLGWNPQKTSYAQLVEIMAKHDRALAKQEKAIKEA